MTTTETSSESTRRSWSTTTGPTRRCAGCSTTSASRRATPTCRCRCATTTPGWSTPVPAASAGCSRRCRRLARPRYLLMLAEVQAVPPRGHRAARRRVGRRRRTARRVRRAARVLRVLRRALHDAARRRRLVVRTRRGDALSSPLPVRLPPAPRHVVGVRLADVADRRRRFGDVRPRPSPTGWTRSSPGMPVRSVQRVADGVLGHRGRWRTSAVRRGRDRHPPGPGAGSARRPDRRPSVTCSAPCRTRPTTPNCTPTLRCCPADRVPARRGTTSSRRTPTTCW